jgi:hypothetical protein
MQKSIIYCPKCKWKPDGKPYWECLPICGNKWNTFETGGICPECNEKFEQTQCIRCNSFSPHKSWYHYPLKPPIVNQHKENEIV